MRTVLFAVLSVSAIATAFGSTINLSTGVASWQVFVPASGFVNATNVSPNGTWASAPVGSSWISYGATQSTSCVVGQTPGNGCANTLVNPSGDIWTYTLTLSAATLGATSGTLSFVMGADNRVNLFAGNNSLAMNRGGNGPNGNGYSPLSGTLTGSWNASNLNGDGSLTLTAFVFNDPISGCPACGDPTGFVLSGSATSGSAAPEPTTLSMLGIIGVGGWTLRRRLRA
jgi:hypothetical protein